MRGNAGLALFVLAAALCITGTMDFKDQQEQPQYRGIVYDTRGEPQSCITACHR